MIDLRGKVCVVTGASSGIGEATVRALAKRRAVVVLAARREELLRRLADELNAKKGTASWLRVDVTRIEDLERLRDHVAERHGGTDVLINNAGIPGGGAFADLSLERLRLVTETNYLSVLLATRLFLPQLIERGGHLINVASLAGRYALPGASAYTASKHAVVAFSESLVNDTSLQGVKVTALCPGFVNTPGFPHDKPPGFVTITAEEVAEKTVDVIRHERIGTVSIPAWPAPLSATQVLTPRLYRTVAGFLGRRYRPRVHSE